MNQTKTVENRVLEVLRACPRARYDDMVLILHYYNRYGTIRAGELPLETVIYNYKALKLPCFETIRRARQRVQSLFPELSRDAEKNENADLVLLIKIGG